MSLTRLNKKKVVTNGLYRARALREAYTFQCSFHLLISGGIVPRVVSGMRNLLLRQHHAALRLSSFHAGSYYNYSATLRPSYISVVFASNVAAPKVEGKADTVSQTPERTILKPGLKNQLALDHRYAIEGIVPDLSTTRPLPLDVPEPPHDLAWPSSRSLNPMNWSFKYLFALGKGYLNLFKTGLKNVWKNWKMANQIQTRIGTKKPHEIQDCAIWIDQPRITYNELELIRRTKRDIRKLPPFALIFAICGEFTPLVILALGSGVLPGTCVIPKQQAQDLQAAFKRYDEWSSRMITLLRQSDSSFKTLLEEHRKERDTESERLKLSKATEPNPIWRSTETQTRVACLEAYRLGFLPLRQAENPFSWTSYPFTWWAIRKYENTYGELWAALVAVQREGGWSKKSPQDMWEWGSRYGLYQLLKYARTAHSRGKDPVSDAMKEALLPAFERESQYLIDSAFEGWRLTGDKQNILDSGSPDARLQRAHLEAEARKR